MLKSIIFYKIFNKMPKRILRNSIDTLNEKKIIRCVKNEIGFHQY